MGSAIAACHYYKSWCLCNLFCRLFPLEAHYAAIETAVVAGTSSVLSGGLLLFGPPNRIPPQDINLNKSLKDAFVCCFYYHLWRKSWIIFFQNATVICYQLLNALRRVIQDTINLFAPTICNVHHRP